MERKIKLHSPMVKTLKVLEEGFVNRGKKKGKRIKRAKLYYLRDRGLEGEFVERKPRLIPLPFDFRPPLAGAFLFLPFAPYTVFSCPTRYSSLMPLYHVQKLALPRSIGRVGFVASNPRNDYFRGETIAVGVINISIKQSLPTYSVKIRGFPRPPRVVIRRRRTLLLRCLRSCARR